MKHTNQIVVTGYIDLLLMSFFRFLKGLELIFSRWLLGPDHVPPALNSQACSLNPTVEASRSPV